MRTRTLLAAVAAGALTTTGLVAAAVPAGAAHVAHVTSDADAGPGSFRSAVAAANADSAIEVIAFADDLAVDLSSAVEFTGSQDLEILGADSTLSGAAVSPDTDTWDSGLFVATGGGDLTVRQLALADSFNNGLAVFLPAGADAAFTFDRLQVIDAQFHGVLVDGQSTTGYNTDDIIHGACTDPHAVDAGETIELDIDRTVITGAGQIEGFDITLDTGCPQDFDGLRVDQGGDGDIVASIQRSNFDGNLADGAELDETGDGSVDVLVSRSTFVANGATEEIVCTDAAQCGDDTGELIADLDDGFDIDEAGAGDLTGTISRTTVDANNDEGLDFDEAGEGSIDIVVDRVSAHDNADEALKASEEDGGDVIVSVDRSSFVGGGDDGTQLEEEGAGDIHVAVTRSTVTGNDGDGVKVEESNSGGGSLSIDRSDLTGNADDAYSTDGVDDVEITRTAV